MDETLVRILSLLPRNENGKIARGARAEFAKSINLKSGNVLADWVEGRSKSYEGYLYEIAAKYNVSVEWLRGETDDPQPGAAGRQSELDRRYSQLDSHGQRLVKTVLDLEWTRCNGTAKEPEHVVTYIRHYLTPAAAGYASLIDGEDYEDIPMPDSAPRGADFCVTIRGDSMEPYIDDGAMVYVKRGAELREFEAGLFFVDGDVYCKQWCPGYGGEFYLLSANPKREDANITIRRDGGRSCVYFGKVLGLPKLPQPQYIR